jgi:solute:Na+ symporter, SSS family
MMQEPAVIDWGATGRRLKPGAWGWIKGILETEYTMWAAFLGSTFVTLATHGTDQDMVQRMLTAKNKTPERIRATILSGIADIPVNFMVLSIGILLFVFYQQHPGDPACRRTPKARPTAARCFPFFILTSMPAGPARPRGGRRARHGDGIAQHGALNSLATSYVRDFHFRWFGEPATEKPARSACCALARCCLPFC